MREPESQDSRLPLGGDAGYDEVGTDINKAPDDDTVKFFNWWFWVITHYHVNDTQVRSILLDNFIGNFTMLV
jgi:hypothetical protein